MYNAKSDLLSTLFPCFSVKILKYPKTSNILKFLDVF